MGFFCTFPPFCALSSAPVCALLTGSKFVTPCQIHTSKPARAPAQPELHAPEPFCLQHLSSNTSKMAQLMQSARTGVASRPALKVGSNVRALHQQTAL